MLRWKQFVPGIVVSIIAIAFEDSKNTKLTRFTWHLYNPDLLCKWSDKLDQVKFFNSNRMKSQFKERQRRYIGLKFWVRRESWLSWSLRFLHLLTLLWMNGWLARIFLYQLVVGWVVGQCLQHTFLKNLWAISFISISIPCNLCFTRPMLTVFIDEWHDATHSCQTAREFLQESCNSNFSALRIQKFLPTGCWMEQYVCLEGAYWGSSLSIFRTFSTRLLFFRQCGKLYTLVILKKLCK